MELSKNDTQKAKGVAIIGMVMLHLFCRLDNLPYVPCIYVFNTPLVYYLGLFGDICVPIYCFCSGYAHMLLEEQLGINYNKMIPGKIYKFYCNYLAIVILFSIVGMATNSTAIPGSINKFLGNVFLYEINYNGSWWFVLTYIILLILSPILIKLVNNSNSLFLIFESGILYFIAYLFRFKFVFYMPNRALS